MQTATVRFLPSASPGVLGYSLSIATASGGYGAGAQIDIPVGAAQVASGGVLEFNVQVAANAPHYLGMRAYSAQAYSGFSNEVVIPAAAAPASSMLPVPAPSASAETSLSLPVATSQTSGVASSVGSSSSPAATGESGAGTDPASTEAASAAAMSSLDLDGAGEYLASSASYALGVTNQFTVSVWALADPQASGGRALVSLRGGGQATQNRVDLTSDTTNLQLTAYNGAGQLVYQAVYTAALVPGDWQHIALTFDAAVDSAPVLLVDGLVRAPASALFTGNSATFSDSAGRVFVGGGTGSAGTWFGAIGHAALWNVALGDDEIAEISQRGHSLDLRGNLGAYLAKDALLHYWRLGEDPTAVGFDYGAAAVPIDLDDPAGNVDAADIVLDAPVLLP